jgi:hypothetical protein
MQLIDLHCKSSHPADKRLGPRSHEALADITAVRMLLQVERPDHLVLL